MKRFIRWILPIHAWEGEMDAREYHLRSLAALMTKQAVPSEEMESYLEAGEYALALLELAAEVDDSIKGRVP